MLLLSTADFFQNKLIQIILSGKLSVLIGLDSDQALHFVGPDLGPNCLKRSSADDKSRN